MHILELRKVPIYESHYNYIKNKYGNKSRLLVTHTAWYMKLKLNMFMKVLVQIRKRLILVIILRSQNFMIQLH